MPDVVLVDYNMGNLFGVQCALRHCGAEVTLTSDRKTVADAGIIVLPGVGAFGQGMEELRSLGLVETLTGHAEAGTPILGICLGMQLLLEVGTEFGEHQGLGIIEGTAVGIPKANGEGVARRVPHVGWSEISLPPGSDGNGWAGTVLEGVEPESAVYFVHSYFADGVPPESRVADCDYGGCVMPAVIRKKNVHGVQFHAEKSGPVGLAIIRRFLALHP